MSPLRCLSLVDDEKFFDAMLLQNRFGLLERRADGHGDERLRRHHFGDGDVVARLEAEVAVGDDADEMPVFIDDGHAADLVTLHHGQRLRDGAVGANRHGINDHARLRAFHFIDLFRLPRDGEIFVNHADAALLRNRNRERGFGDGIHRRRAERNAQRDAARKLRRSVGFGGQHVGAGGNQEHVVKRQSFNDVVGNHDVLILLL